MPDPYEAWSEDLHMLKLFWEKRDLERMHCWPTMRQRLYRHRPDILKAWEDYKEVEMRMTNLLKAEL